MGAWSSTVYALRSVIKNRMRSFYAVIGIVMAISFFSGTFIAVDSSTSSMVRSKMEDVPVDFIGTSYSHSGHIDVNDIDDACAVFEGVDNIVDVEPVVYLANWGVRDSDSYNYNNYYNGYASGAVFISEDSDKLLESYGITGSVPRQGTVAISKSTATRIGASIGDEVVLTAQTSTYDYANGSYTYYTKSVNISFKLSQIWTQEGNYQSYYYQYGGYYGAVESNGAKSLNVGDSTARILNDDINFVHYTNNPVIMNIEDANIMIDALQNVYFNANTEAQYLAWTDRDKVVSPGDLTGTLARLQFINNRLNLAGQPYGFYINFNNQLGNTLEYVNTNMESYKILFFALSLPVMLLGTYLSFIGVDLATSDRRREIGILKARGATKRQILGEMIVESFALGGIAGIFGLIGGTLLSRSLIYVSSSFLGASSKNVNITDFGISEGTVFVAVFFGVLLMLLSAYRPVKRLIRTEIAEGLHFFVPSEAKKDYHMRWDIAALVLSGISIFGVLALSQRWLNYGYGNQSYLVIIILSLIVYLGIALLPALPLLLTVSVIRIFTRGPKKIYKNIASIIKPWTKNVHYLVEKNIERNPKRSSMMCMVIALAIAFGLFVSVTMESTLAYEVDRVRYDIGSDLKVVGVMPAGYNGGHGGSADLSALDALDHSGDIANLCRYYSFYGSGSSYGPSGYITIIDTEDYINTVRPADFWFVDSNAGVLDKVAEGGNALVSKTYSDERSILVGDIITLTISTIDYYSSSYTRVNVEIVGIVNDLPGIPADGFIFDRSTLPELSDNNLVNSNNQVSVGIIMDIKDGSNHAAVAQEVETIFTNANALYIETYDLDTRLEAVYDNPTYGALTLFFNTEYAISMAIMTIGVAMIVFVSVSERRQEIACIMARGASGRQMGKILMGESMTLMTLGFVVGTAVGLTTAFLFNFLTTGMSSQVGHPLVLTFVTLSILIVAVASMLTASFLTTIVAGRIRLAEILRIRGG